MPPSTLDRDSLLYQMGKDRLWVQDSPVLPGVWKAFLESPAEPLDVLITPHRGSRPGDLAKVIRERIVDADGSLADAEVAYNQSQVVAQVTFDQLIRDLVPLSKWYERGVSDHRAEITAMAKPARTARRTRAYTAKRDSVLRAIVDPNLESAQMSPKLVWWLRLIGQISHRAHAHDHEDADHGSESADPTAVLDCAWKLLAGLPKAGTARLFRIGVNRATERACVESVRTIKADVAHRVFDVDASRICWAVMDSGVDALHPAFAGTEDGSDTRVIETWDFTRVRRLISLASSPGDTAEDDLQSEFGLSRDDARGIRTALATGGDLDWEILKPALRVEDLEGYAQNLDPHGTHVAGIIGGGRDDDPPDQDGAFEGVCPDIKLIDIRILDAQGRSSRKDRNDREFEIIAALQFVAHRNAIGDRPKIHGVNLSIQLLHDPQEFACGCTPVCEECNSLTANGVVVIAASGNKGIEAGTAAATTFEGSFRDISISDPGNAEAVITVGSTHRKRPHEYGVSFFSGRGPTGDGRDKPDLVAPGEKILGPVLGLAYESMSGTSQAAPHVSGAAALLLARHGELIGDAERVKRILCDTATDLGREQHFQGAGLVDILRALQSV